VVISRAASRPFLPVSAPSGVPAEHFPQNPRINTFITMNERLQTRGARATGPYRPATRRTERVRRSFCQRTPFVIGASSFFRHSTFVIRHSQTETHQKPPKYQFLRFETRIRNLPATRLPLSGRARHSVRAAIDIQVSKPSQLSFSHCCFTFKKLNMQVPVFTICYTAATAFNPAGHAGSDRMCKLNRMQR